MNVTPVVVLAEICEAEIAAEIVVKTFGGEDGTTRHLVIFGSSFVYT